MFEQKGSAMDDDVTVSSILDSLTPEQRRLIVVYIGALKLGEGFRTLRDEALEALNTTFKTPATDTTTDFAKVAKDDDDMCHGIGNDLERTAEPRADDEAAHTDMWLGLAGEPVPLPIDAERAAELEMLVFADDAPPDKAPPKVNFVEEMSKFLLADLGAGPMTAQQHALAKAYTAISTSEDPMLMNLAEHIARTLDAMRGIKP